MTVKGLIQCLSELPQDREVKIGVVISTPGKSEAIEIGIHNMLVKLDLVLIATKGYMES